MVIEAVVHCVGYLTTKCANTNTMFIGGKFGAKMFGIKTLINDRESSTGGGTTSN